MDSGHSAVQELARHLDEGGASVDADTEEWLLNTAVPAGLSLRPSPDDSSKRSVRRGRHSGDGESTSSFNSSFSEKMRSRAVGGGKSGAMKRTMTAPVALTELTVPANPPVFSPTAVLSRAGVLAPQPAEDVADVAPPPEYVAPPPHGCRSAPSLRRVSKDNLQAQPPEQSLIEIDETPSFHELMSSPFFTATGKRWSFAAAVLPTLRLASFSWEYDVVELDRASNSHGLTSLFHELLRRHDLVRRLEEESGLALDVVKLANFVQHVEATYGSNPYHNRSHAADVLLGVHRFLVEHAAEFHDPGLTPSVLGEEPCSSSAGEPSATSASAAADASSSPSPWGLTALETFAGLFAAAIHDYCHPGTSNAHEIGRDSELALRYHDESVLESHHLAQAFSVLMQPRHNFLAAWDREAYREFRQLVIKLVLRTDLSKHFDFIACQNRKQECSSLPVAKPEASLILSLAIKGADLGHSLKPWPLHHRWTLKVTEEFYALGDVERAADLPISPFCDRNKDTDIAKSQQGFLKYVCRPFFVVVKRVLPSAFTASAVERLDANLSMWASYQSPAASPYMEKFGTAST